MRASWKTLSLVALLAGSAFALADEGSLMQFAPLPAQVAAKQARLRNVVAELRARDVSDRSLATQAARARSLDLLAAYAERGDFTLHHELWPRELPLFIDERGTRCALAFVLDGSGETDAVVRLASECNDAYLNEIDDDPEVARVLDRLGLTLDEAAYIQGPGLRSQQAALAEEARTASGMDTVPSSNANGRGTRPPPGDGMPPSVTPTPGGGTPPGGARGGVTGMRRRDRSESSMTIETWWYAHRDRFLNVRELYRGDPVATPTAIVRSWRPSEEERDALRVRLGEAARADADVRATALAMEARIAGGEEVAPLIEATLAFLADTNQPEREWAPVLFAILGSPQASVPLAEMVADSAAGRARFGTTSAVPEAMRAAMAIALGRSGRGVETLTAVLADSPAAHVELASACVVALGLAAREPSQKVAATAALLQALEDPQLPATVLEQVPAALTLAEASAALPKLFDIVQRFRGPRELRAAAAFALGEMAPEFEVATVDALLALATRDVDVVARQSAILALGTLAYRHGATAPAEAAAKLAAFEVDGLRGRLRKSEDLPWHAIAAGLSARGGLAGSADVVARLRELAADAAAVSTRAAALLALGLAGDTASLPMVIEAANAPDAVVAMPAIVSLGLLGARAQRSMLLARCTDASDPRLGSSAGYALGCLADPMVIAPMVDALEATRSDATRGALARTLGEIGDRRAIAGLSALAFDPQQDELTRERAMAAIGVLGQPDDVAWNAPLRHALHPGQSVPTLRFFADLF